MTSCSNSDDDENKSSYFGSWLCASYEEDEYLAYFTANEHSLTTTASGNYSLTELTWTPINNPGGYFTSTYPKGYKISGKVVVNDDWALQKSDGSEAKIGDIAVCWWYISTDKKSLLGGNWNSSLHEAAVGPFIRYSAK